MNPTLYLAWLSHPEDGGYFAPEDSRGYVATDGGNSWSKYGPLHLSLHTRREAAEAALRDARSGTRWSTPAASSATRRTSPSTR
jgi:hypothetical protein